MRMYYGFVDLLERMNYASFADSVPEAATWNGRQARGTTL
jgi:hypothetical protein